MTGRRIPAIVAAAIAAACVAAPRGRRGTNRRGNERVAIFYYPWYSTPAKDGRWAHWYVEHDGTPVLSTPYFPSRGLYSSSNAKIVASQMREIATAGVGTLVVSWWGFDSPEHDRLLLVEQAATRRGLDIALHIEPYRGRTPARAAEDIARLHEERGSRTSTSTTPTAIRRPNGPRRSLHSTACASSATRRSSAERRHPASTASTRYDVVTWNGALFRRLCTQAHAAGLLCAPSVGPGYDARLATRLESVRPRDDGKTYDRMWKTALKAKPDLVTVTSYNEWQEGTQIEPARIAVGKPSYEGAWGKRGVAAQRAYLGATARWAARLRGLPTQ